MKTPFISSPIGALIGYFVAKESGLTGFWEIMGLAVLGMMAAWLVVRKIGDKFASGS